MSEAFVFNTGTEAIEGRETFLGAGGWPQDAATTLRSAASDGRDAFQLYEAVNGNTRVKVAEHRRVREGLILASEIVVDTAAFAALITGASSEPGR